MKLKKNLKKRMMFGLNPMMTMVPNMNSKKIVKMILIKMVVEKH